MNIIPTDSRDIMVSMYISANATECYNKVTYVINIITLYSNFQRDPPPLDINSDYLLIIVILFRYFHSVFCFVFSILSAERLNLLLV